MGIVDEDIARVREATDLVAIVTGYTQLRKVGQRWTGLCPFHSEKSPSFSVNQADGLYHCFGCKASGDSITFVREMEHLDFPGAVEWLAGKAGIQLRYTEKNESEGGPGASTRMRWRTTGSVGRPTTGTNSCGRCGRPRATSRRRVWAS
jgi:DNA primase